MDHRRHLAAAVRFAPYPLEWHARRRLAAFVACCLPPVAFVACCISPVAFADPCDDPDQAQQLWPGISAGVQRDRELAQTFRISHSGQITHVEFLGNRQDGTDPDSLVVEIRDGLSGNRLARGQVTCASVPSDRRWIRMDFASDSEMVMPGRDYALVVTVTGRGFIGWLGGNDNPYASGAAFWRALPGTWERFTFADPDMLFRIYVCEASTATVASNWSAVKSLFR